MKIIYMEITLKYMWNSGIQVQPIIDSGISKQLPEEKIGYVVIDLKKHE